MRDFTGACNQTLFISTYTYLQFRRTINIPSSILLLEQILGIQNIPQCPVYFLFEIKLTKLKSYTYEITERAKRIRIKNFNKKFTRHPEKFASSFSYLNWYNIGTCYRSRTFIFEVALVQSLIPKLTTNNKHYYPNSCIYESLTIFGNVWNDNIYIHPLAIFVSFCIQPTLIVKRW